jgi:hypothetical protein
MKVLMNCINHHTVTIGLAMFERIIANGSRYMMCRLMHRPHFIIPSTRQYTPTNGTKTIETSE